MNTRIFVIAAGALILIASTTVHTPASAAEEQSHEHSDEYWTCPMHPTVVQSEPGSCSICGMDLVKRAVVTKPQTTRSTAKPIQIDPVVVQNMGVRTALVRRSHLSRKIRTVGSVVAAEDRLSVVNLRFSGWIEHIHVDETGVLVSEGQALVDVYSPELIAAQEELLLALRTSGANSTLSKSARRKLEFLGLPAWQIQRIEKERVTRPKLTIAAPRQGHVIHKNAVAGARINAGQDIYRIADLSRVWIDTEVYEFDAPWVRVGNSASMEFTSQSGQQSAGSVTFIHPTLNERTRTLQVRLELDNESMAFKPGMFATVEIEAQRREDRLVVPTESIIHSGTRQIVFIVLDLGRYQAREIITGLVGDNNVTEVVSGLNEGDRVVTSGQFLLDSESQLREAVQKMLTKQLESNEAPPKKVAAPPAESAETHDHEGETYWTCPMHPNVVQQEPGKCPICGMDLVEKER